MTLEKCYCQVENLFIWALYSSFGAFIGPLNIISEACKCKIIKVGRFGKAALFAIHTPKLKRGWGVEGWMEGRGGVRRIGLDIKVPLAKI